MISLKEKLISVFPTLNRFSLSHGFTLIELLVVISIVMLLSSVVLASTQKSRLLANDAAIKESLIQLRNAYEMSYSTNSNYSKMIPSDLIPSSVIVGNGIACSSGSQNGEYFCVISTLNNVTGCSVVFENNPLAVPACEDLLKKTSSFKVGISYSGGYSEKYLHNYAISAKFASQNKFFCLRSNGKNLEIDTSSNAGLESNCRNMEASYPYSW
jgi:prepilin-type N-terminal cleavage/methylation domain-containing protein